MAAKELFDAVTANLPESVLAGLHDFVRAQREELFAARSEEARVRVVNEYMRHVRELSSKSARKG